MYITIPSIKKTLGKFIEMKDLYIGLPMLFTFLLLFSFSSHKIASLIFLTICVFLMLPVKVSKKNRMYKVAILFFKYIFSCKEYIYKKNGDDINWKEKLKMKKRVKNSRSFTNVKEIDDEGLIHLKTGEVATLIEVKAIDLSLTGDHEKNIFYSMLKVLYQIPNL